MQVNTENRKPSKWVAIALLIVVGLVMATLAFSHPSSRAKDSAPETARKKGTGGIEPAYFIDQAGTMHFVPAEHVVTHDGLCMKYREWKERVTNRQSSKTANIPPQASWSEDSTPPSKRK